MNNSVIIIESPNKVAKIREITGAKVFATIGHFMQLKSYDESNGFKPTFDYDQEKKKHIFEMIEACKNKKVYVATDADREGYAIGYMFYQKIKNVASSIYRAEFFEITPSGINKGLQNALLFENTNKQMYQSALARRVADMLLGFTLSPYLGKALGQMKGSSAGRVQTPCLKLIVDRDREIEKFKALPENEKVSYQIQAKINDSANREVTIKHCDEKGEEIKFNDKEEALKLFESLKDNKACLLKGLKSAGFLAMFSKKELENDESNDDKDNKEKEQNAQFNLKIDDVLSLNDLVLATIKRNAPSAYKEADFVKLLENKGIGRPSTYASYLPTLVKREYISISQDKKHIITPTH